ncbi:MAG: efflux RND transporter periplasmic adaptor subunit [Bryobacteraceae bacterium]
MTMQPAQAIAAGLGVYLTLLAAGCGGSTDAEMKGAAAKGAAAAESAAASTEKPPVPDGVVVLDPQAPELQEMTIEAVHTIPVPSDEVTAPARIEANPNRVGHAVVPAPGRIARVMTKLGDAVSQGQPLVAIESPLVAEVESAYVQSETSVRQAELAVAKAEADLSRISDLFQHQAVAEKEVLAARTTAALTKSSLEQAQTAREQARRRLELLGLKPGVFQQQIVVTAPVSGKVLEVSVVDGEYRNEINTALVTITDLSRVWATSQVPESKIRLCKVGGTVNLELIAYPNEAFRGRVTRIADTVDSETRTIKVSAELDNRDGRLRPDMFGQLRYADGTSPEVWVPDAAVVRLAGQDYVFLEQAPGRFVLSKVELGKPYNGGFCLEKGLKTGQRVVTRGAVYLKASL